MQTMWFKSCYVQQILSGTKTDTIRKTSDYLPKKGDVVGFSVGPRLVFCKARIDNVINIKVSELPRERAAELKALYGEVDNLTQLQFSVL